MRFVPAVTWASNGVFFYAVAMNRGGRWLVAGVVLLTLGLSGCGGDDDTGNDLPKVEPTSADTTAADEKAVVDAFTAYWDEKVAVSNSGTVPGNAFATTATGAVLEDDVTRLSRDAEEDTKRVGAPKFKEHRATVDGDQATVVVCVNQDQWGFVVDGRDPIYSSEGWGMLGRELTRIDGAWLVSGYSTENTRDECA